MHYFDVAQMLQLFIFNTHYKGNIWYLMYNLIYTAKYKGFTCLAEQG